VTGEPRPSVWFEPAAEDGIARMVVDRVDDAVNSIDGDMLEALAAAVHAARTAQPRGLIITSAKQGQWVAGADLRLVVQATEASQVAEASRRLQGALDELAWLPCTTVAAINGAALGGGFELALACDYRIASEDRGVVVGSPEVNLGLVPGGGGTQRLPRLVGLQRALDLILSGRRLNARRARRAGLLDEVVHPIALEQAARVWAAKPKRPLDRKLELAFEPHAAVELAEQTQPGRQLIYRQARQAVMERTHGHYPAPLKALEAIQVGYEQGMAAGLAAETAAFSELAVTETARNLIWLFMATQHARRRPSPSPSPRGRGNDAPGDLPLPLGEGRGEGVIGIVGAGFMGAAIAEVAAAAGLTVRIKDVSPEAVARGLASVRRIVDDGVGRRRLEPREGRAIQGRVSGAAEYVGFGRAEVVIEAVFEDVDLKRQVIRDLEDALTNAAVIASNTSAIPIREIARQAKSPERIVGMHFFSPAERMPLLEVIRPDAASDAAVKAAVALGTQMGKTVIVVGDSPGFYTSRVLGAMLNEAALLVTEGARLEEVDRAIAAFGFPVGPFVLYDEVGLEVAQHAGETVGSAFGNRFPRTTLVTDLVAGGATGRKSGRGFYLWPPPHSGTLPVVGRFVPKRQRTPNPMVYGDTPRRTLTDREIQDRLVLLFVNEAVRCFDEGVLESPTDGDLGAVLGLGFPPFRGGPFHYADSLGGDLAIRLHTLASRHGARYKPADSIAHGHRFFPFQEHP
jgi:3-hydroxyacyl-CoA dehydrogenase/enoyl-CoA hydratase/3-hydroxybutyryl-CoA epimerase